MEENDLPKESNYQLYGTFGLTDAAGRDINSIWDYVAETNKLAADLLIDSLFATFRLLADNKGMGREQNRYIVEMRMFPFKKYHIYYFPTDEGVEIYRVLHGSRDVDTEFEEYFEGLSE